MSTKAARNLAYSTRRAWFDSREDLDAFDKAFEEAAPAVPKCPSCGAEIEASPHSGGD